MLKGFYSKQQAEKEAAAYQKNLAEQREKMVTHKEETPDQEMTNEEVSPKEDSPEDTPAQPQPESVTDQIRRRFKDIFARDVAFQNANPDANEQNPHSNAYLATCSFAKSTKITHEEKNQSAKNYHADAEKKLKETTGQSVVREIARKNLITDGKLP